MFEKETADKKQYIITIPVSKDVWEEIEEIKLKYNLNRSKVVRTLLDSGLEEYRKEDKQWID